MGTPTYRVLYIAGTGRSGSTLIAQWLEHHTDGVHVGELRYLWERGVIENHLCECGSPFDRCEFWTDVVRVAYGSELSANSDELRRLAPCVDRIRRIPQAMTRIGRVYRENIRRYGELVRPLYDAIASVSGAELVIDSSKDPSYLYLLSALDGMDLEPLHIVRDPRAVAYSWTRARLRPEIHWTEQYMRTLRPRQAAIMWFEYNSAFELFMARRGSSARLRYEDFAVDPDGAIRTICRSAGVELTSGRPSRGTGHSLSGNPMRFDRGPRVVRPDLEWEIGLSTRAQRVVTGLTLPLLHRYGYRTTVRKRSHCA